MKYINIPIYLNRFIFIATVALYITIFLGLYAQIVLGAFQLITAFVLLFFWMKLSDKQRERLLKYWFFVGVYGALWYTNSFENLKSDFMWVVIFILIPLSIAGYLTFVLESLKNTPDED
jgi:apolipoprotein N-acyltransferase